MAFQAQYIVDSDAGATRDYATVQDAITGILGGGDSNMVSAATGVLPILIRSTDSAAFVDGFEVNGFVTDASNYFEIKADTGHTIVFNLVDGDDIRLNDPYHQVTASFVGQFFLNAAAGGTIQTVLAYARQTGNKFKGLFIDGKLSSQSIGALIDNVSGVVYEDCVFTNCQANFFGNSRCTVNTDTVFDHCTFFGGRPNSRTVSGAPSLTLMTNCAVFDAFSNNFDAGVGAYGAASGFNGTNDATAPGSNNITSLSSSTEFENAAANDFRLKAGSSLIGAGNDAKDIGADMNLFPVVPTITNIDGDDNVFPGQSAVIAGASFEALQGTGTVVLGSEAQTVTAWADTSITITVVQEDLKYSIHNLIVTTDSAEASAPLSTTLSPASGLAFIDVVNPVSDNTSIFFGASPAVVDGDQTEYDTETNLGNAVVVAADGTFTISAGGSLEQTFSVRLWDADGTPSKWSALVITTVNGVVVSTGGILRNILRSPLKDILRNPIK